MKWVGDSWSVCILLWAKSTDGDAAQGNLISTGKQRQIQLLTPSE